MQSKYITGIAAAKGVAVSTVLDELAGMARVMEKGTEVEARPVMPGAERSGGTPRSDQVSRSKAQALPSLQTSQPRRRKQRT